MSVNYFKIDKKHPSCPYCQAKSVKFGHDSNKQQRYRCKVCRSLFIDNSSPFKQRFPKHVKDKVIERCLDRENVELIAADTHASPDIIELWFCQYLLQNPDAYYER